MAARKKKNARRGKMLNPPPRKAKAGANRMKNMT